MTTGTRITAEELLRVPDDGYRSRTDIAILTKDEELDGGAVVPDWTLNLRELFA